MNLHSVPLTKEIKYPIMNIANKFYLIMDPKTLSNLDPKLRETYERVMGSAGPTGTQPAETVAPPPAPADGATQLSSPPAAPPPIPTPTATPVDASLSQPVTPAAPGTNPFQTPVIAVNEPAPLPSPASVNQNAESGTASPLVRILYIVGAIVFFAVYTFFWMKVFNLQLPF